MCRDLKIQSQASKSKAKYEVGNFCTQYGLPSVIPKRKSKHRGKEPSEKSTERKQPPSTIENRSSRLMISIRKENPSPQESSYLKHQKNVLRVEKEDISRKSVKLRSNPLSIPLLVTKPVKKKSSNS